MSPSRSASRRSALGYLAVLRGASTYHGRARQFHTILALIALVLVVPSRHALVAVPVVLVALCGPTLNYLLSRYRQGRLQGVPAIRWAAESVDRKEGRHQLNLPGLLEILGAVALIGGFSWVVTDLPTQLRLIGLLTAVAYTVSVTHAIFSDHTWYNPAELHPPRWHEAMRSVVGLSTALLVAGLALPGHWTAAERGSVAVVVALPLVIGVRLRDLDQTVAVLGTIVAEERARGRQLVIDETDRALSEPLAELERLAEGHWREADVLLGLVIHARRRLHETLAAARRPQQHPPTIDELLGPVLTLARAIGVSVQVNLRLGLLSRAGEATAAWVLRDLVGNAINADGSLVLVTARRRGDVVVITVGDDGTPMPARAWKLPGTSSARLERHLILLGGSLEAHSVDSGKVVTAEFLDTSGSAA